MAEYYKEWINIKLIFPCEMFGIDRIHGMTEMLKLLNLKLEGRHHSGIDDVKNIAQIVLALLKKGVEFSRSDISKGYKGRGSGKKECRYGVKCRRKDCKFYHPSKKHNQ